MWSARRKVSRPGDETRYPWAHDWVTYRLRLGRFFLVFGWYEKIPRRQSPELFEDPESGTAG